jgi:sulfate adenylyltransferase (ADP) / ATP adenylyltransferase
MDDFMESWKQSDDASAVATDRWLPPGALWTKVEMQHELALESGALKPFATTYSWVEHQGVQFLVRVLGNLKRKENAKKQQKRKENFNPFLPYEEDLFVADLSPTHLVLLNKFNVMDYHILMVTRKFESQEDLLTAADFQALAIALSEMDGLAFYNGGKTAGSSQPHKHLQLVPLPLVPESPRLPIESLMLTTNAARTLPYRHVIASLDALDFAQPLAIASILLNQYQQLMEALALWPTEGMQPLGAYNLLVTRQWMCVVPRSQESFDGISINSLGFAGALLVKDGAQLAKLQKIGPMTVLTEVGLPCA